MAEMEAKKYLDLQGLQLLWQKISEKYPRTAALPTLLDELEDPFLRKSLYDEDQIKVNQKLEELEIATGTTMDGDTIIRNAETNKLQTNLIIDLDTEKKTLRLVTKDPDSATPKAKTVISEIDYTPFVKDGMLDSVSIVVVPDDEDGGGVRDAGTYLKFIFNTAAGKEAIYLDASEFINIYKGSDYIIVEGDKISLDTAKLDAHVEEYISTKSAYISNIVTRLSTAETTINNLRGDIVTLQDEIGGVRTSITELTEKVTGVEQTVTAFDIRVGDLEEAMKTVPNTPITADEINELS